MDDIFSQIFLNLLDALSNILIKDLASSFRQDHFCLHGKCVIKWKEGWREGLIRKEVIELKSSLNTEAGSDAGILHQ